MSKHILGIKSEASTTIHINNKNKIICQFMFVIPGGRFNEIYYWDTFWIVQGLILCDMFKTAKGIIENFLYLVLTYGHIPNGSRIYYRQRSQPPMLTLMMESYLKATKDFSFIKQNIDTLDKEMDYWNTGRSINFKFNGKTYKMYRYHAPSLGPRPESYREDMWTVSSAKTYNEKMEKFIELKSAAESGWDFSSRWFINEKGTNKGNLSNLHTSKIIPVDLNAILHKSYSLLSQWYDTIGNKVKSKQYHTLALNLQEGIQQVLWNDLNGVWFDYDILNGKQREYFYMSNFVPLWTKSYTFSQKYIAKKVMNYIRNNALFRFIGGLPTSMEFTSEQWDYPNAWPPLQAFLIQGLQEIGVSETSHAAFKLANTWIKSNYEGFKVAHKMFEKYDALKLGLTGSGGEYVAQDGFGWTNGVILEFLDSWGDFVSST